MPTEAQVTAIKTAIESKARNSIPKNYTPRVDTPSDTQPTNKVDGNASLMVVDGAHIQMYDYFNLKPYNASESELNRLQYLNERLFKGDIKKTMRKINDIELKLGKFGYTDSSENLTRLYNYLRVRER